MEPPQYQMPPTTVPPAKSHHSRRGLITVVLAVLLVVSLAGFVWAFTNYREYKDDVDPMIAAAVSEAEATKQEELEVQFQAERDRLFNVFKTDPGIANVTIEYPRDWSQYLEHSSSGSTQIEALFHPVLVMKADPGTYALRLQVRQQVYDEVVADYQSEIEKGELTATALTSNGEVGLRLDGLIDNDHTGAVVILPIRDKTLVISTEALDYMSVFNEVISKLVFTP